MKYPVYVEDKEHCHESRLEDSWVVTEALALNTGRNDGRNISYHISRMRLTKVGIIAFDNGSINPNGRLSTRKRTIASISLKTDLMWWSVVPSPRERRF